MSEVKTLSFNSGGLTRMLHKPYLHTVWLCLGAKDNQLRVMKSIDNIKEVLSGTFILSMDNVSLCLLWESPACWLPNPNT